jgi:membrane protease YdiL (CAAX protease family)
VGPALAVALIIGLSEALHVGDFRPGDPNLVVLAAALVFNSLTLSAVLSFGEEYGWRGYLLPKLLPLGEIKAGVIVGIVWGLWHAPLLIAGLNSPGVNPLVAVAIFIPAAVAMSMLFTRLYVAAGASVLVVTVLHASLNSFADRLADGKHLIGDALLASPNGAIGIGVLGGLALLVYTVPAMRRRRASRNP